MMILVVLIKRDVKGFIADPADVQYVKDLKELDAMEFKCGWGDSIEEAKNMFREKNGEKIKEHALTVKYFNLSKRRQ
jgi:hypothetical protein